MNLKSVTVTLSYPPSLAGTWEADDAELRVLRALADQIRTRRAFHESHVTAAEMPDYFIESVLEFRGELRVLLDRLPIPAINTRLVLLHVQNRVADILDAWHKAELDLGHGRRTFERMDFHTRIGVMEAAWPAVEAVRRELALIADEAERLSGVA